MRKTYYYMVTSLAPLRIEIMVLGPGSLLLLSSNYLFNCTVYISQGLFLIDLCFHWYITVIIKSRLHFRMFIHVNDILWLISFFRFTPFPSVLLPPYTSFSFLYSIVLPFMFMRFIPLLKNYFFLSSFQI